MHISFILTLQNREFFVCLCVLRIVIAGLKHCNAIKSPGVGGICTQVWDQIMNEVLDMAISWNHGRGPLPFAACRGVFCIRKAAGP